MQLNRLFMMLFVTLFLLICSVHSQPSPVFDHFVFSQQWPMSVCIDSEISHMHNCSIPANVSTWTVHGIWPTEGHSEKPDFCNRTAKFNPDAIACIRDQLEEFWPNLYLDSPTNSFWEHEWDKHGTCAMTMEALDSELKYFTKGIELRRQFDILSILHLGNIIPKDLYSYPYSDFESVLSNGLGGFAPTMICTVDKSTNTQYILEVEFCLDKTFAVMECPHKEPSESRRRARSIGSRPQVVSMVQRPSPAQPSVNVGFNPHCNVHEPIAFPVIQHAAQKLRGELRRR